LSPFRGKLLSHEDCEVFLREVSPLVHEYLLTKMIAGDDYYYNNIWIIAAKTSKAASDQVKREILEMLYHDDYRGLIDRDIEDVRDEKTQYVTLPVCGK
jgi:RNA binding exosome subunit